MFAKRILCGLLAFVLFLGNMPLSVLAEETLPSETQVTEETIVDETTLISTETSAAVTTVETVPETTAETVPETTAETVPETTAETVPETTAETVPETTAETVPETTVETVPETTAETVPETTAETVPETTEETVPETTAETVPETTEETVPETTVEPGPVIVRSGTCGKKLKWVVTDDTTLTITGTGKMYNYTDSNSAPWSACFVKKAVIASGVTSIGNYAFDPLGYMAEISIPNTVTRIGSHAFSGCDQLTQITIPDSVTTIGSNAFRYCRNLEKITLSKNLTSIGSKAFYACESLTSVSIPEGITAIPAYTFWSCSNLRKVVLPDTLTSIGQEAFLGCRNLQEIQIPSSVNTIGERAFYSCTSLKKITIPEGVTRIRECTFERCENLAEVTLPKSLTRIGTDAFDESGIRSIVIPDNVTYIGTWAFSDCPKLETVYFEDDPKISDKDLTLDALAFEGNDSLYCVALPKDLVKVGGGCFYDCIDLEKLIFAGHLPILGNEFAKPDRDLIIYYPEGYKSWENSDLWDTYNLWPYDIMPPVVTATNIASTGKPKLTWISYRKNVTYEVYRATKKDGQYSLIASTRKKSYTDTSAKSGTLYYYKVRTSDIYEFGDIVSKYCDLPAPKISTSIVKPSGKPKISWKAVTGAKEYKVYYSRYENGPFYCFTTTSKTSAVHQEAIDGRIYYYKVKAVHKHTSANSALSAAKSRQCSLSQPVFQLSNDAASGHIKIKIDKNKYAKSYQIYRSSTGADGSYRLLVDTTETRYTDTDVIPGEKYYYKVKAILGLVSSANSSFSAAKYRTCDLPRPKVKYSNVAATGKITLSWDAVEGAVKYKVYRKETSGGDFKFLGSTTKTRYINNSSQAGQWYEYKVKAIHSNTAANSALSRYVSHTCDLPAPVPSIALNTAGKPVITWDAIDGAVKYQVYRSTTGAVGSFKLLGSPVGTRYTNTGAVAGTTYYYKVKAIHSNTIANSAFSTIKSITAK